MAVSLALDAQGALATVQRRAIGHAALILLIGMLAGVGLLVSLLGGIEVWPGSLLPIKPAGATDAWVRAHLGGMLNAFLIILVALTLPLLGFDMRGARRMTWLFVGTGWANTLFYWAAFFSSNRALTFGDNRFGPTNPLAGIGLAPALVFVVLSIVAVAMLARQAWRH
jgi:hypothetical protein